MGVKGFLRFLSHRIFEGLVIVLLIVFMPNLPPYTTFFEKFSVLPFKPFEGKSALNDKLNDVEIWHKGDLIGPETLTDYNGVLYTGLSGGDVVKLVGNQHITPVLKTGKPCKGSFEEKTCGRPLGMTFDKTGALYVADAYYGIFKVNVQTGEKKLLISPDEEINGKKPKLFNDVVLSSDGNMLYWTDSSTDFYLENIVFDLLADPTGRLIQYNLKTKKNNILIDKLSFANGVALSKNEDYILVAESGRNRIHRYYLNGPQKDVHNVFIDGLPGMPDNLKADGNGGFFVPLVFSADADHPILSQVLGPFPLVRKFLARVMGLTELAFETIDKVYPNDYMKKAIHFVGHCISVSPFSYLNRSTILHVSENGNILDSLHNTNGKISGISDVHVFKGALYFASPFNDYIARIPLSKVGWQELSATPTQQSQQHNASPTQQTPLPQETVPPKQPTPTAAKQIPPQQQRSSATTQTQAPQPKEQTPSPPKQQQTAPPPPKQEQTRPPQPKQQQTPPPPPKQQQQTPPPPPKQQQQTPPPPPKQQQQTPPPPPKQQQQTPPPPHKQQQQTPPPPPKQQQQTSPPPPKQQQQTPPPPPKQQQQTPPPPPKQQQQTPPPPPKQQQQTPPQSPKQQQQTPPPPPKQQQTTPSPPKQQQTTPPPPKQQQTTPPPAKQQQTTPPQPKQQQTSPPPPKQQQTSPPSPKQQQTSPPPPKQQQTPPPPPKQQTPPPPKEQQTPPPPPSPSKKKQIPLSSPQQQKQTAPSQHQNLPQKEGLQQKQSLPVKNEAQESKELPPSKAVPIKESTRSR